MADVIGTVLDQGGYLTGAAWRRLEKLWDCDFAPISAKRSNGYPYLSLSTKSSRFLVSAGGV
jgi:hypothetical protein